MSDTPITDALDDSYLSLPTIDRYAMMRSHARQLERNLANAESALAKVQEGLTSYFKTWAE